MTTKRILTFITPGIAGLTLISCLISISYNNLYNDGVWANTQWLGQDMVTLLLAMPLLLISFNKGVKSGRIRWKMVYTGILFYYVYTYSFFMFAANLSVFYLFHLPIFGLSLAGFMIAGIGLFNTSQDFSFQNRGLKLTIIFYLIIIAAMVSFLWLSDIFAHLTDPAHQSGTPDGQAPLIIYSLDLGIVIPFMVASAIMIYRNSRWGYLLCGIILTKTSTLGFALMAMSASMYLNKHSTDPVLIALWFTIGLIGTVLTVLFMKNLNVNSYAVTDV